MSNLTSEPYLARRTLYPVHLFQHSLGIPKLLRSAYLLPSQPKPTAVVSWKPEGGLWTNTHPWICKAVHTDAVPTARVSLVPNVESILQWFLCWVVILYLCWFGWLQIHTNIDCTEKMVVPNCWVKRVWCMESGVWMGTLDNSQETTKIYLHL